MCREHLTAEEDTDDHGAPLRARIMIGD